MEELYCFVIEIKTLNTLKHLLLFIIHFQQIDNFM